MQVFKDQIGRTISLERTPDRIVSLVPSQTELLCDLGLANQIVGLTRFCVHPSYIKSKKTIVGGTKQIRIKKIAALDPDIICCNKEENTREMVLGLEQIAPVHVSDIYTVSDSLALMKEYGEIFDRIEVAAGLVEEIEQEYNNFLSFASSQPVLKVGYFIWKDPWMVAAGNTFINHLLEVNNFQNVFSGLERYPEISIEDFKKAETPDIIFLSSEPYPFKEEHLAEMEKTFPESKVMLVDGEYFSWYGSRLKKAFGYFRDLRSEI